MRKFLKILLPLLVLFAGATAAYAQYEPQYSPSSSAPQGQVIRYDGFTLSWNSVTRCPDWVTWELTADEARATAASRTDEFLPDPDVPLCPVTQDYSRSGYDRGHMCPAADMKWSERAMEQSFYLTNICPQDRELNAGLWLELEQRCRVYAKMYGAVWICCGPVYGKDVKTLPSGIAVPEAFFKSILLKDRTGKWQSISFLMPNRALDKYDNIFNYCVSAGEVERLTGLVLVAESNEESNKAIRKALSCPVENIVWDISWKKR